MPNSGSVTSPAIGMIFKSSLGESRFSFSNSCRRKHRIINPQVSINKTHSNRTQTEPWIWIKGGVHLYCAIWKCQCLSLERNREFE
jgi:hypothetical protein